MLGKFYCQKEHGDKQTEGKRRNVRITRRRSKQKENRFSDLVWQKSYWFIYFLSYRAGVMYIRNRIGSSLLYLYFYRQKNTHCTPPPTPGGFVTPLSSVQKPSLKRGWCVGAKQVHLFDISVLFSLFMAKPNHHKSFPFYI